ncbi:MAG: LuxR C-terminal-related transcriptional regulator [Thermomicrobiales bacterium]
METQTIARLIGSAARFLTLIGPGGVGKTRLAIRAAQMLVDRFPGGVVFVPLADVGEADQVLPSVARVLRLRDVADRSPEEAVRSYFSGREALLVLDNLEHLVEAGPGLSALLMQCPHLRMLTTSRRPVEIYGEHIFRIQPLAVPPRTATGPQLRRSDAVQLFVDRARAVQPGFETRPGDLLVIGEIVARLDGLPLAIELAAARLGEMPAEELLRRLIARLPLLVSRNRDMPERLQTMRNAIRWSYDALEPVEKLMFRRLAIFSGSFGLKAAAAVADICDCEGEKAQTVINRIADASLLLRLEWSIGEPRYGWLETIREFGLERLKEADEFSGALVRLAEWYAAFSEEARTHLHGPEQRDWLDRIEEEYPEIRAALVSSLEFDSELALRICAALWLFWNKRGHQSEGRAWLADALERAEGVPPNLRAEGLMAFGSTVAMQGDLPLATDLFDDALSIWRELRSDTGMARTLTLLGNASFQSGDFVRSIQLHNQALCLYSGSEQAPWEGVTKVFLGFSKAMVGDDLEGQEQMRAGLMLLQEIGETWAFAVALSMYGDLLFLRGDIIEAARSYASSLERLTADGEPWTAVWPLGGLAAIAQVTSRNGLAARLIGVIEARVKANGGMLEPTATVRLAETVTRLEKTMAVDRYLQERVAGSALSGEAVVNEVGRFVVALSEDTNCATGNESGTPYRGPCGMLTPRERDVLILVADGLSDKAIGDKLFISPRTVANHMNHILGKLGVGSRAAAVAIAIRGRQI